MKHTAVLHFKKTLLTFPIFVHTYCNAVFSYCKKKKKMIIRTRSRSSPQKILTLKRKVRVVRITRVLSISIIDCDGECYKNVIIHNTIYFTVEDCPIEFSRFYRKVKIESLNKCYKIGAKNTREL